MNAGLFGDSKNNYPKYYTILSVLLMTDNVNKWSRTHLNCRDLVNICPAAAWAYRDLVDSTVEC